jgi:hypothetical protein
MLSNHVANTTVFCRYAHLSVLLIDRNFKF